MSTAIATPSFQMGAEVLERILAVRGNLIALDGVAQSGLVEQMRSWVRRSGQSVYLWSPEAGLGNLREEQNNLPGSQRLSITLRYVQQSNHFGVYLLQNPPMPLSMADVTTMRQLARANAVHVRKLVLLDPHESLVAGFKDVVERLSCQSVSSQRPRLRDGRWVV